MSLNDPNSLAALLVGSAANIVSGTNPAYTSSDFLSYYPHFQGMMSGDLLDQFVEMANAVVQQGRWRALWSFGMANFIAHMATMYLSVTAGDTPTAGQIVSAGQAQGVQSSKSVGSLSVSYDFGRISEDLKGWGDFTLTKYGQMYASKARLLGKGGMYVQ